jgi:sugar lactone lactonase YvrE
MLYKNDNYGGWGTYDMLVSRSRSTNNLPDYFAVGCNGFSEAYTPAYDNNWHFYSYEWEGGAVNQCKLWLDGSVTRTIATGTNPFASLNDYLGFGKFGISSYGLFGHQDRIVISDDIQDGVEITDIGTVPNITSATPDTDVTYGGVEVVITGTNFTTATGATIGGVAVTNFVVDSDTQITCNAPAGAAGDADITVTNPEGTGTLVDGFTYTVSVPTITTVAPASVVSAAGAVAVELTGTNYYLGVTVTVGGHSAINVVRVSSTSITCTFPFHLPEVADVVVTNTDTGTVTAVGAFEYILSVPTITSVAPVECFTNGLIPVKLTGDAYYVGCTVTFGGTPATNVTVNSINEVECIVPAHAAGAEDVVLTNIDGGTVTAVGAFEYLAAPTITASDPAVGPVAGGTAVTLTTTGVNASALVYFDATLATDIVVVSATQVTCKTPAHLAGYVNISIYNTDGGIGTLISGFYYQAPAITQSTLEYDKTTDLRVYLRRKRQNAGNKLCEGDTASDSFVSGTIDKAKSIFINNWATNLTEMNEFNADGTFNQQLIASHGANLVAGSITFNDCFYAWINTTGSSALWALDSGLTSTVLKSEGSAAGEVLNPEKIVIDDFQNMYVADTGNDRINLYRRGTAAHTLTKSYTPPSSQMAVDNDGNIYVCWGAQLGLAVYDKNFNLLRTLLTPYVILSVWYDTEQDLIYVLYKALSNKYVYKCNKVTGVSSFVWSTGANILKMSGDSNYIYLTGNNTSGTIVGYNVVLDKYTGAPVTGVVGANGEGYTNKKKYFRCASDGYIYAINWDGTVLTKTNAITGELLLTINRTSTDVFISVDVDKEGFIYIVCTAAGKVHVYNKEGVFCYSWSKTGYDVVYNAKTDDVLVTGATGAGALVAYSHGLYVSTFGANGTGNGQFDGSLHGLAVDSDGTVYTAEYGATERVQKITVDQSTGVMTYASQLAVAGGAADVAFNTSDNIAIGIYATKQIVMYLNDLATYWATFFIPENVVRMYTRDGILVVGGALNFYVYNINSQYGAMLGEDWREITDYVDFSSDFSFEQTSAKNEFSLGEISYGSVTLKLTNEDNCFDIEYMEGSIFHTPAFDFCRNDSLIKIMVNDKTLFIGAIDGKNCKPEDNLMNITAIHILDKLKNIPTDTLGLTSAVSTVSDAITAMLTNIAIVDYITYAAGEIDITDYTIDDVSELPDNGADLMALFARVCLFTYGLKNGKEFFTYSLTNEAIAAGAGEISPDYIITNNEMMQSMDFNRGEQRIFGNIIYEAGSAAQAIASMDPRINWIYNDKRNVTISSDAFTNAVTRQAVVDQYKKYYNNFPSKEFTITIPLIELLNDSFFKKIINIASFADEEANNFNTQSLPSGNVVFPNAQTCIYTARGQAYINYQVIGVKHTVGKKDNTTLTIKEIIKLD